jgi:osmoprotectant transport system ATP-binding protein
MGDKIAILREGGHLAQYDTPAQILMEPADEFVASFVGADRALKRLGLETLADVQLLTVDGQGSAGTVLRTTTVRDALSQLLAEGGRPLTVVDEQGREVGRVTLELLGGVFR